MRRWFLGLLGRHILWACVLGWMLQGGGVYAKSDSVSITADSFQYDMKKRVVRAVGRLTLTQSDVTVTSSEGWYDHAMSKVEMTGMVSIKKGDFVLKCQRAIAYPKENRIELEGAIGMTYQDIRAEAQRGVYYRTTHRISLSGMPKVWQNQDLLSGSDISIDIANKVVISSGGAFATFSSEKLEGVR